MANIVRSFVILSFLISLVTSKTFHSSDTCSFESDVSQEVTCLIQFEVEDEGYVESVESLSFFITATSWFSELSFKLISPSGVTVVLNRELDCEFYKGFINGGVITLDDGASQTFTQLCKINPTSSFVACPVEPLSKLVGQNVHGNWILEVYDNYSGDGETVSVQDGGGLTLIINQQND